VQLTARPVTAPAAKNLRPSPGAAPDWQPGTVIPVRSPALLTDASVVQPGGIAGHLARAAGEVIASLVS
jgi:hypothetical protein